MKEFCIAGPIIPEDHYFISRRLDWDALDRYIESKLYFVLHAPRQSGKTTAIEEYITYLNAQGRYSALYINVESAQAARDNVEKALIAIIAEFKTSLLDQLPGETGTIEYTQMLLNQPHLITLNTLAEVFEFWAKSDHKPKILFIDEIDALIGDSLLSVLRQIRRGFSKRPGGFPQSMCLIGLRDVRDYRIWSKEKGEYVSTSSPFNIKSISLTLSNFTLDEVRNLYEQHTHTTGQQFTSEAVEYAFYLTKGQPWLVNALAQQVVDTIINRIQTITKHDIEQAKNVLILRRDTHIDSLIDKLHDPRVRNVIDAIISGTVIKPDYTDDDIQYTTDLGLISATESNLTIANPIYQEIIPAVLANKFQVSIVQESFWYLKPDGLLDMPKLLTAFTEFFRENSQAWLEDFDYKESGPHILMLAFMQRIINGGGRIHREYALGRRRVDLLVIWKTQCIVIELKIKRGKDTSPKGIKQTAQYMDLCNATEGHLVIFDRNPKKSWKQKISRAIKPVDSTTVHEWNM